MGTIVMVEADSFANGDAIHKAALEAKTGIGDYTRPIRRPYRGIQIKDDTYATLSIRLPSGKPLPLVSTSKVGEEKGELDEPAVLEYADFILQQIDDNRQEKQQIIETFGAPYIYFYGERPRIANISGMLINSDDFRWRSTFWHNYDKYLRGTKLAQMGARAYLSYDSIVIEGYPLSALAQDSADNPYLIPFQMTLVVTNYYDLEGETLTQVFPGNETRTLDSLNSELANKRNKYVSTTEAVRAKNLSSMGAGGVLAGIRNAIRTVNSGLSAATNFLGRVNAVLGGRNIRVPMGVAGYLATVGEAQIATGSIATRGSAALLTKWDKATGTYKTVMGSLKLRVPALAVYAPAWESPYTNSSKGYIFENYDEYPTWADLGTVEELVNTRGQSAYEKIKRDRLRREAATQKYNAALAIQNQVGTFDSIVGDIADGVNLVKSNFGMVMNTAAMAIDPVAVTMAALGIGIGVRSGQTNQNITRTKGLTSQFVKDTAGKYVGFAAASTFKNMAERIAGTYEPQPMGGVYSAQYNAQLDALYAEKFHTARRTNISYDPVYGGRDYTTLVSTDPTAEKALTTTFGDTDANAEASPASIDEVYGKTASKPITPNDYSRQRILDNAQNNRELPADEDTSGIRGVEDNNAPIEPVK